MNYSGLLKYSGKYTPLILAVIVMLGFACSKDVGNYDYEDANAISINTATDSFAVRQNDTLHIAVNLHQTQGSNTLRYRWYLIQNVPSNPNPPLFDLDSTKDLHLQIRVVPGLYKVVNKVTDNQTGVSFYKYFKLNVLPAPWGGEGWLVLQDQASTQNGCDLSIILSRDGSSRGDVYHNLYQQANSRKLPLGTYYMSVINHQHSLARQKVMFAYPGGGTEVKAIDYSDSSYFENWFLNPPAQAYIQYNAGAPGGQREFMINNGQVSYRSINLPNLATGLPILFGAPYEGTWELAPFLLQHTNLGDHYITLYDKKNRCFFSLNMETHVLVPNRPDIPNQHFLPYSGNAAALLPSGMGFDLNNMRHNLVGASNLNQLVQTTTSVSPATWNCFFRNDDADSTWVVQVPVYLAYTNNMTSGRFYLSPARCPGINEATLIANPKFLAAPGVLYYVNKHQVYTTTLSSVQGNSAAVPGYSFPAGTIIKALRVFESGYSGPLQLPRTPFPDSEGRVLVVATDETSSGGGHNVYFIGINNNGSLQPTYLDKYTGFDKIIDIRFKKDVNR